MQHHLAGATIQLANVGTWVHAKLYILVSCSENNLADRSYLT